MKRDLTEIWEQINLIKRRLDWLEKHDRQEEIDLLDTVLTDSAFDRILAVDGHLREKENQP